MPIKFITVCLFFVCIKTWTQTHTITGVVIDSLSNPLPYTNILAKPLVEHANIEFVFSDEKGNFKLVLKKELPYVITVSYLGHISVVFEVKLANDISKNIQLFESNKKLNEVIVFSQTPISIKEDTIVYNTNVFTSGEERKLKQVLKLLPGVEINKDGEVFVNGKKVTRMMVDGKIFFGGGTKLAIENIPANAVAAVEVLDHYNQVSFLKELTDSEEMAMNIILKENKKKFIFGDIDVGTGTDQHYLLHPNIFYYSLKTNLNFIGDLNDIGTKSFTINDYLHFEGGFGKMIKDANSYVKFSNDEFAQFLKNDDFISSKNKFGAFNIAQTISKKIETTAYAIYSNTKEKLYNKTLNQYISEETETLEAKETKGNTDHTFVMAKLSIDYVPKLNEDISYTVLLKSSNNYDQQIIETATASNRNDLKSRFVKDAITMKHNFEWHKKLLRNQTISLSVNYHYDNNSPSSTWLSNLSLLPEALPLINDSIYNINQLISLKLHHLEFLFKHYWVINHDNHIYSTFGNHYLKEYYSSRNFQKLNDGSEYSFYKAGFANDLTFQLNDIFYGMQHKFKAGIAIFKYGLTAHYYQWKADQSTIVSKGKIVWLPDLLAKFGFSQSSRLNFKYHLKSSFVDAPKYANRFIMVNYNALSRGNENLENEIYHNARLWYTKLNLYKGLIIGGSIEFDKKIKSIRDEIVLSGINFYRSPVYSLNPETSWIFSANIRKAFGKVTLKANGMSRFSNYQQLINQQHSKSNVSSYNFSLEMSTKFKKWPNIEVGYKNSFNEIVSSNNRSSFYNTNPYFNLEYDFLNGFILSIDYSKNIYNNYFDQKNHFEIANASLFYQKENSPWGFRISGSNMLGAEYKYQHIVSDYINTDNKTYIMPRISMFTLTYKL